MRSSPNSVKSSKAEKQLKIDSFLPCTQTSRIGGKDDLETRPPSGRNGNKLTLGLGTRGLSPSPNSGPSNSSAQDCRGVNNCQTSSVHPYHEICIMSAETMILILQRLNEIANKLNSIEGNLNVCIPPNPQRVKPTARQDYIPAQVPDVKRSCRVLQKNQIVLEIHKNEHRWTNRKKIMTSLSQLLNCRSQEVDLEKFHFLPSTRNSKRLFMTFNNPVLPSRLIQLKNFLWQSYSLHPRRVFKDEQVRELITGRTFLPVPETEIKTRSKREDKSLSLELGDLRRRLDNVKSAISTLDTRTQELETHQIRNSPSNSSPRRRLRVQLSDLFSSDSEEEVEFDNPETPALITFEDNNKFHPIDSQLKPPNSTQAFTTIAPKSHEPTGAQTDPLIREDLSLPLHLYQNRTKDAPANKTVSLLANDPHFAAHASLIHPVAQKDQTTSRPPHEEKRE